MSKNYNKKIKSYLNTSPRDDLMGYTLDDSKAIYFSNGFSIIKLFDTTYTRKQRGDLMLEYKEIKEHLQHSIKRLFAEFQDQRFNKKSQVIKTIKENDTLKNYNIFENNDRHFDVDLIIKLARILSNDEKVAFYTSEENKDAICLVGSNGVAFLLGCRTY